MHIGFTMAPGKGDVDLIMRQVAQSVIASGYRPAGTAQTNSTRTDGKACDMDVLVLPSGPRICISQSLGPGARGCRLNPSALEDAVSLVQTSLPDSDCLIVNKFGKHEAEGRGFRSVIADALAMGLPVVVGLNELNAKAFHEFSANMASQLRPDPEVISAWLLSHLDLSKPAQTQKAPLGV